jgi:hypothetical protein
MKIPALIALCAVSALAQTKAAPKAAPKGGGQPPKAGLSTCAGKIEGRYAESALGQMQIEFRSGKATLKAFGDTSITDCWMAGKKVYLYMPGDPEPMEIDINNDGTLQTPLGEFKKKGD